MTKYWENLELNFDPFDPNESVEPCFLSEQGLYLLDLITQLSCHSHAALLVLAQSGGGKSTLAKAFVEKLGANGVCQIRGDRSISIDFLRYLLAKHLGIAYVENQPEQFNKQLAQQLETMAKNRQKFYIVIDDAQALPERTLAGLLTLASRQPHDFPPLHMVFFGSLPLETTISDLVLLHNLDIVTHTSRMKPFDLATTKNYISHCLKVAGHIGEFPLTDNEVEQIYVDADGLPGYINQEVVGYLSKKRMRSRATHKVIKKRSKPKRNISVKHLIATVGLVVLVGVAFMVVNNPVQLPMMASAEQDMSIHHETAEYKLAGQKEYIHVPTQLTSNDTEILQVPEMDNEESDIQQPQMAAVAPDTPAAAPILAVADDVQAIPVATEPKTFNVPAEPVVATESKTRDVPVEPVVSTESTIAEPNVAEHPTPVHKPQVQAPTTPNPSVTTTQYSVHEKNLLGREASHYTLQLMGAYDNAQLRKFAERAHLTQDAWYFHTWHNHKRWFVIVYGDYATRQDAEYAAKQLPKVAQDQHPWVRSLASVKSAITKTEKTG